ncbi:P27 family phage terminase small subunit [Actinoallomurus iriomotensis]|uniref:Terminase small subunit n=1 Tax=Actinoallomurus iriomotensis TaxID=478107 RepID=A0A9W6RTQ7_9ACTN|nr:P27 family phage terminase small subunit [Actinoallomurus iriomotensis]GLY81573.1 hypothetical protein Airi01_098400 [Actinoallomurus iriomotensis]
MTITPTPPEPLGTDGTRLWTEVFGEYDLDDFSPGDLRILASAAACLDTIAAMREALTDAPLIVQGSMRQQVANPLIAEIRFHRAQFAALMRQLGLEAAGSDKDSPRVMTRTEQASRAARARWAR